MINDKEVYNVMAALVPLYVPMILAYYSVRWWKIFTPEQCSGINRFVAIFAIPFLTFHFLSSNSPYTMNILFIAADTLQKVVILGALFLWTAFAKRGGGLDWTITLFSLSTLPNTLIVGVPLLTAMYGDSSASLMSQLVFMQGVLWFTLMLFLYEYQGAMHLFLNRIPDSGDSIITTFTVDPDVNTLNGNEPLLVDLEKKENGELHVMVRSSSLKIFNRSTEMCCAHLPKRRASSLFMALQPKIIACGKTSAAMSIVARCLVGPAVIGVTSIVIGIRGVLLRVAIVQAAIPQSIVAFVFAKEYNIHADILSTAVIFGTAISLPATIMYFVLLGL
ncbi:Auxin efflux carrier component 2 [Glycine soja]|uniref:Auxin efflux carrier component 2 n=1 Tax=Glycine soja TaxID=3848 RepID=A0A0B2PWE0_GLYSO|nr:Auxin efflux carrier component 2 [Glycine soja]